MELSVDFAVGLVFRSALSFLALVAFAGAVAVPTEGLAIRLRGRGSRMHRAANGVLYTLCGLTVAVVFYTAGGAPTFDARDAGPGRSRVADRTSDV